MIPIGLGAKLAVGLALLAAVRFGMHSLVEKGRAECQQAYAAAALKAQADDAKNHVRKLEVNQEVRDALQAKAEHEAATAAALRSQLDRVRIEASAAAGRAASSAATTASGTDATGRLIETSIRLAELAERARADFARTAAKVAGLQDYAARVCQP